MVAHNKQRGAPQERVPGIIFTTSTPSKLQQCANSVLGLLDVVSSEKEEDRPNGSDSVSISDAIARELEHLSRESKKFRFSGEVSRGIGLITLPKNLIPSQLVHDLLMSSLPVQPPMFLSRIIPIDFVSAPNLQSFENTMLPVIKAAFDALTTDVTWKVVLDKHGLTNITKENLVDMLLAAIPERHEVSIHEPQIVVMVQVTQKTCGVALLKDYDALCEYNIRKLILQRASIGTV